MAFEPEIRISGITTFSITWTSFAAVPTQTSKISKKHGSWELPGRTVQSPICQDPGHELLVIWCTVLRQNARQTASVRQSWQPESDICAVETLALVEIAGMSMETETTLSHYSTPFEFIQLVSKLLVYSLSRILCHTDTRQRCLEIQQSTGSEPNHGVITLDQTGAWKKTYGKVKSLIVPVENFLTNLTSRSMFA